MPTLDLSQARWRKSSRSNNGNNGNCVEIAREGAMIAVRDSKNAPGPTVAVGEPNWRSFLHALS